jgi:hypothetical protein
MRTLHENLSQFMILSLYVSVESRKVSNKCRENMKIHFMPKNLSADNRTCHEIITRNTTERDRTKHNYLYIDLLCCEVII